MTGHRRIEHLRRIQALASPRYLTRLLARAKGGPVALDDPLATDSARSIVTAMHRAGTQRLIVVSGTGPFDEGEGPGMRYVIKPIGRRFLKYVFADFVEMEKVVRASGLDWTIVRPPRLTDKPFSGNYRTRRDLNMHRNFAVSRADVAHLILAACADRESYDAAIYIAS